MPPMQADPPLGLQRQLKVPLQSETAPDTLRPSQIDPPGQDIQMGTSEALPQPLTWSSSLVYMLYQLLCISSP